MPDPTYQPQIRIPNPFMPKTGTFTGDHGEEEDLKAKLDEVIERLEKLEAKSKPSLIIAPTAGEVKLYGNRSVSVLKGW